MIGAVGCVSGCLGGGVPFWVLGRWAQCAQRLVWKPREVCRVASLLLRGASFGPPPPRPWAEYWLFYTWHLKAYVCLDVFAYHNKGASLQVLANGKRGVADGKVTS